MPGSQDYFGGITDSRDRRRHSRQITTLNYIKLGESNGGILLNISEEGLAFTAAEPLVGEFVPRLRFQLEEKAEWIEASGRIVWLNDSQKGAGIQFGHELRELVMSANRVGELRFGDDAVSLAPDDVVVMAVPPRPAASLLPGLQAPSKFRAIVNAHFRFDPPKDMPPILGVVGGLVEWLFAFPQRLSVTISSADRLVDMPREELAQAIWRDVCKAGGVQGELPPWQIVRERRATFEATPEQNALRPAAVTGWKNLFLAGDWTDTGLPATIEGSVRSGDRAADLVLALRA